MTPLSGSKRIALAAVVTVAVSTAVWMAGGPLEGPSPEAAVGYPELFGATAACPSRGDSLANGRRAEELGLLRADRYAYNPRDGVRAVERFRLAEACYRSAGAEGDAARVQRAHDRLSARVNTDYAAARLNLLNALQQERWSDAQSENRRLLLLTEHLRRHEYVEWLKNDIGRIAARASAAP